MLLWSDGSGRRCFTVSTSRLALVGIAVAAVLTTTSCASSAGGSAGDPKRNLSSDRPAATQPTQLTQPSGPAGSPGAAPSTVPQQPEPTGSRPVAPPASGPATGADGKKLLPRGGTELFPRYRLVGYSGGEASKAFGRLGIGRLDARIKEIERTGRAYTAGGRTALPVLELITVIVHASPGEDGKYRSRIDDAQIARYLAAARRHKGLLLLNIQPGRADFLPEVKSLERWLAEPDVGIALDPEWAVGKNQTPGRVYGRTTAKELNAVAAYLSAFTRAHQLPEKAMVVHQLAPRIIDRVQDVRRHPGVEIMLSVDGIGARVDKEATWRKLVKPLPTAVRPGFKLFFEEDREHGHLMTPRQVLQLKPTPDYVLYE
jgi:hypothetical protein